MSVNVYALLLTLCTVSGDPTGCTYYPSELKYECSARSWVLPLTLSDFDHVPQSLSLIDVNGDLPSSTPTATFSGFEAVNTSSFDIYFVPTFIIRCYRGGMLIYHAGTFIGLRYFKNVHIQNCEVIAMPDDGLQDFGDVNYFGVEGGTIGDIGFDAFKGLNVCPMNIPRPHSTFLLTSKLDSRVLPNGVLYALTNVTNFVIDNANIDTLQVDMFQTSIKLQSLSLRYNLFTSIPNNMLSNLLGLRALHIEGIELECTCGNVWFLDYCQANNISIRGSVICSTPSTYKNKKAYLYKKEQCPAKVDDPCKDSLLGFPVGATCLAYLDISVYILILLSLSIVIVTVLITVHTRRQYEDYTDGSRQANGQQKLSEFTFNRVSSVRAVEKDALRARLDDGIGDEIL